MGISRDPPHGPKCLPAEFRSTRRPSLRSVVTGREPYEVGPNFLHRSEATMISKCFSKSIGRHVVTIGDLLQLRRRVKGPKPGALNAACPTQSRSVPESYPIHGAVLPRTSLSNGAGCSKWSATTETNQPECRQVALRRIDFVCHCQDCDADAVEDRWIRCQFQHVSFAVWYRGCLPDSRSPTRTNRHIPDHNRGGRVNETISWTGWRNTIAPASTAARTPVRMPGSSTPTSSARPDYCGWRKHWVRIQAAYGRLRPVSRRPERISHANAARSAPSYPGHGLRNC